MNARISLLCAFVLSACRPHGPLTDAQRTAAIAEIGVVLDSINAGWRRADFVASQRPTLDDGVMTFNGYSRMSMADAKARTASASSPLAGQYIADYQVRYDVLSPDVAVTTWENDFARIRQDSSRGPMQVALMSLVWKRTGEGWRILYYHESTWPKARMATAGELSRYAGSYQPADGPMLEFTVSDGALNMRVGDDQPEWLETFTAPTFGLRGALITFVNGQDGTVQDVVLVRPDGSSRQAWRIGREARR